MQEAIALAIMILCSRSNGLAFTVATQCANMTPMASDDYAPTPDEARVFGQYKRAYEKERELRPDVKKLAAAALHRGATNKELMDLTGLSDEFFRRIARAEGIERQREPTVGREVEAKRTAQPGA